MGGIKKDGVVSSSAKSTETKSKTKSAASKKTASSKKPVAGIDENGTFRAWDNAKSKAKEKSQSEKEKASKTVTAAGRNRGERRKVDRGIGERNPQQVP